MGLIRTIKGRLSKTKTTAIAAALVALLSPILDAFGVELPKEQLSNLVDGLMALALVFLYKRVDHEAVNAQNEAFLSPAFTTHTTAKKG